MLLVKAVWSFLLKERTQLKAKLCRWSTRTSTTGGGAKLRFFREMPCSRKQSQASKVNDREA